MKKILALVLAAVMLCGFAAMAEEVTVSPALKDIDVPEGLNFQYFEYGESFGALMHNEEETLYYTLIIEYNPEFVDAYGEEATFNTMSEEDLEFAISELTFDYAQPRIAMAETGYGTKVIVVDDQGSESEYASLLTIYHGYFVGIYIDRLDGEQITDAQIQDALDIMTSINLD